MNLKEAAAEILRQGRQPLKAKELVRRVLAAGLWRTTGKTPHATLSAQLYTEIRRKGEASVFVQTGPQTFGLRELGHQPMKKAARKARKTTGGSKPAGRTYSFTNSAEKVLKAGAGEKPMHYRDITRMALAKGWLNTEGKTPEATMYAQISSEIKRQRLAGKQPRFVQHGKGMFGLSAWMGKGLAFQIERQNAEVRKDLHQRLFKMPPDAFEALIGEFLVKLGFEDVEVTEYAGDKGIDVRGMLVVGDVIRTRMAVQVKRWKKGSNVRSPDVQRVRGSLGAHEHGLIITTSDFAAGARDEAARPDATPVALMNGEQLVALMLEHEVGVTKQPYTLFQLDDSGEQ